MYYISIYISVEVSHFHLEITVTKVEVITSIPVFLLFLHDFMILALDHLCMLFIVLEKNVCVFGLFGHVWIKNINTYVYVLYT